MLADVRLARGDRKGARESAARALELDAGSAGPHVTLGDVALAEDWLHEAEGHYRTALAIDPEDTQALNNLGVVLQGRGDKDAAMEAYERAARIDPSDETARKNLAATGRDYVNGFAFIFVCWFLASRALLALSDGDTALGVALLAALAGAVAFFVVRARRRKQELSTGAQMHLSDQRWWQKIELTSWRPLFWLIPSPVWLVLTVIAFVAGLLDGFEDGWDGTELIFQAVVLALAVVFARSSRAWLRRRGWISF